MNNKSTNIIDRNDINKLLYKELGKMIHFSKNNSSNIIYGKLYDSKKNESIRKTCYDYIPFYIDYQKNNYLKLGVSNNIFKEISLGHKLVGLSILYEILCSYFDNANIFYIMNDVDEIITFQWFFNDNKNEINKIKNNYQKISYFKEINNNQVNEFTRRTGFPYELVDLIHHNLVEFIAYKKINEIDVIDTKKLVKTK